MFNVAGAIRPIHSRASGRASRALRSMTRCGFARDKAQARVKAEPADAPISVVTRISVASASRTFQRVRWLGSSPGVSVSCGYFPERPAGPENPRPSRRADTSRQSRGVARGRHREPPDRRRSGRPRQSASAPPSPTEPYETCRRRKAGFAVRTRPRSRPNYTIFSGTEETASRQELWSVGAI